MKKVFLIFLCFLILFSFFSCSKNKKIEITVLHSGAAAFKGDKNQFDLAMEKFKKDYPEVKVNFLQVDLSDGSTLTMDAMLAAGNAPNIYIDTLVRASKYMVADFALPLNDYIRDIDQYQDLSPYTRDGKILALPVPGSAQGMAINLEIMKEIGYEVPPNWTIDDFLIMAEKVKLRYGGTKWATGMFAANQSGDYLINNWFASFGAKYYNSGDYSKCIIADSGGEKAYEFFQYLSKQGYIPPGASTLTDDDYVIQWAKGDLAATAFFPSWIEPYFQTVIKQGQRKERFEYRFVPFPRYAGVEKVPTYYMNGAILVYKSKSEKVNQAAARFAEYVNGKDIQEKYLEILSLPNRRDVVTKIDDPYIEQVNRIVIDHGIFDVGLTNSTFALIRPLHYPILQRVLNLEISPEEAINLYQKKINEVLK